MAFLVLVVALAGLALALARGAPIAELSRRRFTGLWALYVAAGLHLLLSPLVVAGDVGLALAAAPVPGLPEVGGLVYIASLAAGLLFLALNRQQPGLPLILAGLGLNFAAIVAYGGHMPGDPAQLERAGLLAAALAEAAAGRWSPFVVMTTRAPLWFLGDVIYLPLPLRGPIVISVGDLVILAGVLTFLNPVRLRR